MPTVAGHLLSVDSDRMGTYRLLFLWSVAVGIVALCVLYAVPPNGSAADTGSFVATAKQRGAVRQIPMGAACCDLLLFGKSHHDAGQLDGSLQ